MHLETKIEYVRKNEFEKKVSFELKFKRKKGRTRLLAWFKKLLGLN